MAQDYGAFGSPSSNSPAAGWLRLRQAHDDEERREMPRYDYRCSSCDEVYELSRPMAEADSSTVCPNGHEGAVRLLPVFAAMGGASAPAPQGGGACCGGGCCG
jgi:putative FmdB family regulatory protein